MVNVDVVGNGTALKSGVRVAELYGPYCMGWWSVISACFVAGRRLRAGCLEWRYRLGNYKCSVVLTLSARWVGGRG